MEPNLIKDNIKIKFNDVNQPTKDLISKRNLEVDVQDTTNMDKGLNLDDNKSSINEVSSKNWDDRTNRGDVSDQSSNNHETEDDKSLNRIESTDNFKLRDANEIVHEIQFKEDDYIRSYKEISSLDDEDEDEDEINGKIEVTVPKKQEVEDQNDYINTIRLIINIKKT